MKKALFACLFCLISIAVCFGVGELYARIAYGRSGATGFMTRSPVFHHVPPPYFADRMTSTGDFDIPFKLNNRGMHATADYRYEKPSGVYRIAVLGDSFTFGMGVAADETASAVLQRLLDGEAPGKFEVYNFGVPSYSPVLEYIYLTQEVVKYDPDLVILFLDLGDVQDDYKYEQHLVYDAQGNITGCDSLKRRGRTDLWAVCMAHSRLLTLIDQKLIESLRKIHCLGAANYFANKKKGKRNKAEILLNPRIDNIYFDKFLICREGKAPEIVLRHGARTARYVARIKNFLDARRIRFIMVAYPYGHQVGPDQWSVGRTFWGFEKGKTYDPAAVFSLIGTVAEKSGIDLINLYGPFRAHNDEMLYFANDGHWTARAHEIAARAIFEDNAFRRDTGR